MASSPKSGLSSALVKRAIGPDAPPADTRQIGEHEFVEAFGRAYRPSIEAAARRHGIDPALLDAVAYVESKYDPHAGSSAGAEGLLQLTKITQQEVGVHNTREVAESLDIGAKYLAALIKRFGSLDLALAAWNAGPTVVAKAKKVPPYQETIDFIKRVKSRMEARKRKAMPMWSELPEGWVLRVSADEERYEHEEDLPDEIDFDVLDQAKDLKGTLTVTRIGTEDPPRYAVGYVRTWTSNRGLGPYLYDKALDWVSAYGGTLESDKTVSTSAAGVWQKYMGRSDVEFMPVLDKKVTWNSLGRTDEERAGRYNTHPPEGVRATDEDETPYVYDPAAHPGLHHKFRKKIGMPMLRELPPGWRLQEYVRPPMKRTGTHPVGYMLYVYNQDDEVVASLDVILPDWDSKDANYVVAGAQNDGPPGLGPFLYEKALDWATALGGTIESDVSVSSSARGVWQKYYERAQRNELRALPVHDKKVYWNGIRRHDQEGSSQEPPGLVESMYRKRYTPEQHPELHHRYRKGERLPELPEGLHVAVRGTTAWPSHMKAYEFRLNDAEGYTQVTIDVSLSDEEGKTIAQVDWAYAVPSARGKGYGRMLYNYILKWVAERGAWLVPGGAVSHDAAKAWRAIQRDPGVSREPHPSADPAMNNPDEGLDEDWTKTRAPQLFYRYRKDAEEQP